MTSPGMGDRTGRSWWPWVERVHGGGELRFVHGACTIMWLEDLTPQQLSQLRAALEERRGRARGEVARLIAHVQELHVPDVGDGQDVAAGEASRQRAAALLAKQESALAEIEAALARMNEGTYGYCEETEEPIPFARLTHAPETRWSVEAQELREATAARDGGEDVDAY